MGSLYLLIQTQFVPPFSSVQSLSRVRLFATPWIAARQASLSITISRSSLKFMSIESVMHPAISSSVVPFSSFPQSLPASESFPVLWPPHAKSWLIGKDSDAGRDWGQEEKVTTEDEMAGWHHQLYGHEFEWTPGVGDGQGGLACCDSWGHKETRLSDWIELKI